MKKIILKHNLDVGDVMMMTIAVRDLHMAYPGEYLTDVRTCWPDLWKGNPYITPIDDQDGSIYEVGYPLIQNAGSLHFSDAFRLDLADQLGVEIPWTSMNPDLHLSDAERAENIIEKQFQYSGKYWVINAGYKADVVLKHYPFWQEVCNLLKNEIQIVQVGAANDYHTALAGVFNLIGETSLRDWIKVIYRSEGTIGPISAQMVCAAAFNKPSVVVAGGKEPGTWQKYNYHRYLDVVGTLPCAAYGGCWTGKYADCKSRVGGVPRCFAMISPEEVARNVLLYYDGGRLSF